ncbi:nucleoside deaminase [Kiritimatiellota bacterium B12222]|nr:nucleoside deaminase [Kiritimatiellota bacterium B12222]
MDFDTMYMRMAIRECQNAAEEGEVPIGAMIVHPEKGIIGKSFNQVEMLQDATAHAEVLAITQACQATGNWRLEGCTLYVTKEPCPMCAGAIVFSRIAKVVWGVSDPARGGESVFHILNSPSLVHRVECIPGILEEECKEHLVGFFRGLRANRREIRDAED